ncbi:MAG: ThuA domain-containing protein [Opitutaceae bacterium]
MKNKSLILVLSTLCLTSCYAKWAPNHNDAPVAPNLVADVEKALPKDPIVRPKESRSILVFSATAGYRHKSIPLGKLALEQLGESTGAYDVVISDDPANFELDALKKFDAIVLLSPTGDFFMPNKKQKKKFSEEDLAWLEARQVRLTDNIIRYVADGGGLVGIHSATDACYEHENYGKAIGGYFDGHPWRANTNVTITVEDPEHGTMKPVFGDLREFSFKEEIYQFREEPYTRDRLRVLMHVNVEKSAQVEGLKRKDNDYAVAWVQSVGKGRVFYTSLGHNDHIFTSNLMLKHFLAGIQFATGDLEADTTPSAKR